MWPYFGNYSYCLIVSAGDTFLFGCLLDEAVAKDFCGHLRDARTAKGWTQKDLSQVSHWMRGICRNGNTFKPLVLYAAVTFCHTNFDRQTFQRFRARHVPKHFGHVNCSFRVLHYGM